MSPFTSNQYGRNNTVLN